MYILLNVIRNRWLEMADEIIVNEVLCFVLSHYGQVPATNVQIVMYGFFTEDELVRAKSCIYDVCNKHILPVGDIPRLTKHKGEDKKKKDADDILTYVSLLDQRKVCNVKFAAVNLRRVPQIEPGSADPLYAGIDGRDAKED